MGRAGRPWDAPPASSAPSVKIKTAAKEKATARAGGPGHPPARAARPAPFGDRTSPGIRIATLPRGLPRTLFPLVAYLVLRTSCRER